MAYTHLLDSTGKQPSYVDALGYRWSSATPSEVRTGMEHSFQVDEDLGLLKFELRDTANDYSADGRRRSEISLTEIAGQMAVNGQKVWNTYLFRTTWTDPAGMKTALGSTAMSISQLKPNSGGSPTRAHRLTGDAFFRATTTASTDNVKRYTGTVRMDDGKPHRIVEAITCHPTSGRWELWLDGVKILDFSGAMGASTDGYSLSYGLYSGAIKGNLLIEYADIHMLSANSLSHLINAMTWPTSAPAVCPTCGQALAA